MSNVQDVVVKSLVEGTMTGGITEGGYDWQAPRDPSNEYSWSSQWVMSVSVAPYNPEVHLPYFANPEWSNDPEDIAEGIESLAEMTANEGVPTHMCRIVARTEWDNGPLELVDGTELYLQVDESTGSVKSIWEEIWDGSQPDYYGGPIPEAREWVNALPGTTGECYFHLDSPFVNE